VVFVANLKKAQAAGTNHVTLSEELRLFLQKKGVALGPVGPTDLFVNDREGVVGVRTTQEHLKKVGPLLAKLNQKE
jgi:hypothetical protein